MALRKVCAIVIATVLLAAGAQAMAAGVTPKIVEAPTRRERIRQAIQRGVAFLQREQLPYGEFPLYWSEDGGFTWHEREGVYSFHPGEVVLDSTPFATAHILYSLQFVKDHRVNRMVRHAVRFLQEEMEPGGLWRYWSSHSFRHDKMVPNIQDTAVVSLALVSHGIAIPRNVETLLKFRSYDHLFLTYMLTPEATPTEAEMAKDEMIKAVVEEYYAFNTPDCVINGEALAYLAHQGTVVPEVCEFLMRVVREGANPKPCSLYFTSQYVVAEVVSRAYREGARCLEQARSRTITLLHDQQQSNGFWGGNPMETALGALALLNFEDDGDHLDRAMASLLTSQQSDGGWPRASLFGVVYNPGSAWGSSALTTGFVLEAFGKYLARKGAKR